MLSSEAGTGDRWPSRVGTRPRPALCKPVIHTGGHSGPDVLQEPKPDDVCLKDTGQLQEGISTGTQAHVCPDTDGTGENTKPSAVVHSGKPSSQEAEAGGSLASKASRGCVVNSKPDWTT